MQPKIANTFTKGTKIVKMTSNCKRIESNIHVKILDCIIFLLFI